MALQPPKRTTNFGLWAAFTVPAAAFAALLSVGWFKGLFWPDSGSWVWYIVTSVPFVPSILTLPWAMGKSVKDTGYFISDLLVAFAVGGLAATNAYVISNLESEPAIGLGLVAFAVMAVLSVIRLFASLTVVKIIKIIVLMAAGLVLCSTIGMVACFTLVVLFNASDALAFSAWVLVATITFGALIVFWLKGPKNRSASFVRPSVASRPRIRIHINWRGLYDSIRDLRHNRRYQWIIRYKRRLLAAGLTFLALAGLAALNYYLNLQAAPPALVWITALFGMNEGTTNEIFMKAKLICCCSPVALTAVVLLILAWRPGKSQGGGHIVSPILLQDCAAVVPYPVFRWIAFGFCLKRKEVKDPKDFKGTKHNWEFRFNFFRDWWLLWPGNRFEIYPTAKVALQHRDVLFGIGPGNQRLFLPKLTEIDINQSPLQKLFRYFWLKAKTASGEDIPVPLKTHTGFVWPFGHPATWPKDVGFLDAGLLEGADAVAAFLGDVGSGAVKVTRAN